ncbi:hypothetical protein [Flaviaesturariibacter terrae]
MKRLLLPLIILLLAQGAGAQRSLLLLKKGARTVARYWEGGTIAFQLSNGAWQQGDLVALRNDSVFVQPRIVRYYMIGNDTLKLPVQGYPLQTLAAFPRPGVSIEFRSGAFGVSKRRSLAGTLLQVGAIGYTALGLVNGLREGNYSLSEHKTELAVAGAVYALGFALKRLTRYTYPIGSKYHIESIRFDRSGTGAGSQAR